MNIRPLPLLVVTVIFSLFFILGTTTTSQASIPSIDVSYFASSHQSIFVSDPVEFIKERIKVFEGFRSYKYRCSVSGTLLQGYGTSVAKRKTPTKVTEKVASIWIDDDLKRCVLELDEVIPWWRKLSQVRQAALLDLTYNMGITKLLKFKNFLASMESGNYDKAAKHLLTGKNGSGKSRYAKQVGIRAIEVSSSIVRNVWMPHKFG